MRKVNALMARYNELNDAAAAGDDVNWVLNHRGLGRMEDEERVLTSLGSRDQDAARKSKRLIPPPCQPPTAPRRSQSQSGSAILIAASERLVPSSRRPSHRVPRGGGPGQRAAAECPVADVPPRLLTCPVCWRSRVQSCEAPRDSRP
jgi:hypothetical protein